MTQDHALFSASAIRDAIGQLADGMSIDDELLAAVRTAIAGSYSTTDRGQQQFVACLLAVNQHNVDTEELIWPKHPDEPLHDDDVPLAVITQADLWREAQQYWLARDPIAWTAFVWRIAVPLANRLGLVGSIGKVQ